MDPEQLYCQDGLIKICKMFSENKPKSFLDHSREQLSEIIQSLPQGLRQKNQSHPLAQFAQCIFYFLNRIYLFDIFRCLCEQCEEVYPMKTVSDRKVIKVIVIIKQMFLIESFIQGSIWRETFLDAFIEELKKLNKKKQNFLKRERISIDDLKELRITKRIFEEKKNLDIYVSVYTQEFQNSSIKFLQKRFYEELYQDSSEKLKFLIHLLYHWNNSKDFQQLMMQFFHQQLKELLQLNGVYKFEKYLKKITQAKAKMDKQKLKVAYSQFAEKKRQQSQPNQ